MTTSMSLIASTLAVTFSWNAVRVVLHPRIRRGVSADTVQLACLLGFFAGAALFFLGVTAGEDGQTLSIVGLGIATSTIILLTSQQSSM